MGKIPKANPFKQKHVNKLHNPAMLKFRHPKCPIGRQFLRPKTDFLHFISVQPSLNLAELRELGS